MSHKRLSIFIYSLSFFISLYFIFCISYNTDALTTTFDPTQTFNISPGPLVSFVPSSGTLGGSGGPDYCTCPTGVAECTCPRPEDNGNCPVGGPNAGQSTVQCGPGTTCSSHHGISQNVTCCSSNVDGTCSASGTIPPLPGDSVGPEVSERPTFTNIPIQSNIIPGTTSRISPTPTPPPAQAPTLDLKIRKAGSTAQYQDGLLILNSGESVDLVWQTSNVSVCDASSGWSGRKDPNGGREIGTGDTSNLTSTKIFTLTCVGQGGVVTDFVIASVLNPSPTPSTSCLGGAIGCPTFTPTPSISSTPTPSILTPTPSIISPVLDLKGRPLGSGATFTDGPITINFGTAPELQWTSANVTSCTATNAWTGSKQTSGTEPQGNLFNTAIYVLTCTGPNGTVSDSFVVNVLQPTPTPAPNLPFLDLKIRPLNSGQAFTDGPITINQGQPVELQWNSQNVSNCTASNGWNGSKATDGAQSTSGLSSSTTFTLTCTGPNGTIVDSVQAIVIFPTPTIFFPTFVPPFIPPFNPPSTPFVDIKIKPFASSFSFTDGPITIQPGNGVELQWTSSNVSSCFATGGWSGAKSVNGSDNAQNIQFSTTFTITCNGPGGTVSDSVTALVSNPVSPQISILKSARNLTQNSSVSNDFVQARPGDTIEFSYQVRNTGGVIARNITVSDLLPNGLQYVQNSTSRDGVPQPDVISSGLSLGDLQPGETRNVTIRTIVTGAIFAEGVSRISNIARARGSNIPEVSDSVLIEINKPFVNQTPPPQPATISKQGRNLTQGQTSFSSSVNARPGDRVEFQVNLRSGVSYPDVVVRDILPSQFTIIPNTITLDGRAVTNSNITNTGISLGTLNANTDRVIRFIAILADEFRINGTLNSLTNFAEATSRGTSIAPLAQLPININRAAITATATPRPSSPVVEASQVPTGTTEAIFLPVGLGFILLLAYMAYTKTKLFKIRELEAEMQREREDKDRFNMMN